jgi:hypothetical protein
MDYISRSVLQPPSAYDVIFKRHAVQVGLEYLALAHSTERGVAITLTVVRSKLVIRGK